MTYTFQIQLKIVMNHPSNNSFESRRNSCRQIDAAGPRGPLILTTYMTCLISDTTQMRYVPLVDLHDAVGTRGPLILITCMK